MKLPAWLPASRALRLSMQAVSLLLFLLLFVYVCWPYTASPSPHAIITLADGRAAPAFYALDFQYKERLPAESFLVLDPLTGLSASLCGRILSHALWGLLIVGFLSLLIPRGFCSYVCPLGTLVGCGDWVLQRISRGLRLRARGVGRLRWIILAVILVGAVCGLQLTGFAAAIPVLTRGLAFILNPLHLGITKGWHNIPALNAGMILSIILFITLPLLGLISSRFWCRYVCPSGALLGLLSFLRLRERTVSEACTSCGKCLKRCPFDAINSDFSTDAVSCTFCRTCREVCPADAIAFSFRKSGGAGKTGTFCQPHLSRRTFLGAAALGAGLALGIRRWWGQAAGKVLIRPPGSIPEDAFLGACVRCGECLRVCPNSVLQPAFFEQGLDGLWTPRAVPDWSGCDPSCNNCGQVCPTGAIRALALAEKRAARMGLAEIDGSACLPWAGREECEMCADECRAAGYDAIEFERIGVEVDEEGFPIEGSGFRAPVMLAEACVGCGLCQTRCYRINVKAKALLTASAIQVAAGPGREDRMRSGSYVQLRRREYEKRLEEGRRLEREVREE